MHYLIIKLALAKKKKERAMNRFLHQVIHLTFKPKKSITNESLIINNNNKKG